MLKLLWNNYWIDKKSTLWVKVDDFYTKQHEENLKFFDDLDTFRETIMRLRISQIITSPDENMVESTLDTIKVFWWDRVHYKRVVCKRGISIQENRSFIPHYLCKVGMPESFIYAGKNIFIDLDFSSYDGMEKFCEYVDFREKDIFLRNNGFDYNPHIKKYINTIYSWNLFQAFDIFKDKVWEIDDEVIESIIKLLPKNILEIKKQSKTIYDYPKNFTSFLEITLKDWEKVDLVECDNNIFFSVNTGSKDIYHFFRELYISYLNQYKSNFNKKIVSLLDLSSVKIWRDKGYGKDILGAFWNRKEIKEEIKKMNNKEPIQSQVSNMNYILQWWIDRRREDEIVALDISRLEKGDNIDWSKYDISLDSSGKMLIDPIKEYIKSSNNNIYVDSYYLPPYLLERDDGYIGLKLGLDNSASISITDTKERKVASRWPSKIDVSEHYEFQKACLKIMWINVLKIFENGTLWFLKKEMNYFFRWIAPRLMEDFLEKKFKTQEERFTFMISILETASENIRYLEYFEDLLTDLFIVESIIGFENHERCVKLYNKLEKREYWPYLAPRYGDTTVLRCFREAWVMQDEDNIDQDSKTLIWKTNLITL